MSWLTKGHAVLPARESVSNEATVLVCGPINRGATEQELQLNRVLHSAEPSQVLRLQVKLQLLKTVVYGYESAFNKPTVITMAFLTSAAIVNCLLLLTLVVILSLCPPLGVDAYPVLSRHRRRADDTPRNTHRTTTGATPVIRPDLEALNYEDSWENLLEGEDADEENPIDDYMEDITSEVDNSASSESSGDHSQRRRELNEALTSRMLREQRRRRRSRQHLAIYAIQALTNNLQSRAVCGWTYRNNHDMKRIPADLPEAVCDSLTVAGTRNRCEQVYYNVPVRKLVVSSEGVVSWSANFLALKVGCTLATAGGVPYSVS